MGTVADILALAHDQLGNGGARYWDWYTQSVRPSQGSFVDGNVTPYCAEYVSWLLAMTGTPCEYFPNPCAFDARDIPEGRRIYGKDLRPGDLVAFDWDDDQRGDHVGIVRSVCDWGCNTNEGNTGADMCVHERQRTWDLILFGIRPEYEEGSDVITDEDVQRIAAACASYVWGEADKKANLNMYNATHWCYQLAQQAVELLKRIAKKVGA